MARLGAHVLDGAVYRLGGGGRYAMNRTSAAEMRKRPQRDGRVCAHSMGKQKKGRPHGWERPLWKRDYLCLLEDLRCLSTEHTMGMPKTVEGKTRYRGRTCADRFLGRMKYEDDREAGSEAGLATAVWHIS